MDVKILKIESGAESQKTIQIEVTAEEVTQKIESLYKELGKSAQVPGFRVGHAPRKILETRFGKRIRHEAIDDLLPTAAEQAMKDSKLQAISTPTVTDIKDTPGSPLQFTIQVEVRPEFQVGNYKGLTVKKEVVTVSDDEITRVLAHLQEQHAEFVPVTDRASQNGDFLLIDFEGKIDGKKFEGGSSKGYMLELGKKQFLPEFESALLNQSAGTSTTATVTFPEDYGHKEIAGKTATFKITLREIKLKKLPVLDDEFAKDLGEFDTLAKVKEKIEQDLKTRKETEQTEKMEEQIIDQLIQSTPMDLPASMVDKYSQYLLARQTLRLRQHGLSYEAIGTTAEKAKEDSVEVAKKQVKTAFILETIGDAENISVTDEELDAEVKHLASHSQIDPAKYKEYLVNEKKIDGIRDQLRENKVLKFILDQAQVELAGSRIVLPK
ncbi:MAG: trigger factor [bacterium]